MSTLQARQQRADWLQRRRQGIGGSDVAAILGLSPFKTALDIFGEKRGLIEPRENEAMSWGHRLEGVVAQAFTDATGIELVTPAPETIPFPHPQRPWQLASPDRLTADAEAVVEIKTASYLAAEYWGASGSDDVPEEYLIQLLWYLNTLDAKRGHIAVLIGGQEFRCYTIERNPRLESVMVGRVEEFWRNHVLTGEPPPATPRDGRTLARIHKQESQELLSANDATDALGRRLAEVRESLAELTTEEQGLEVALKEVIGPDAGIAGSGWKATWKQCKPKRRFDSAAAIKAGAIPQDVVNCFTVFGEAERPFIFKKIGD